MQSSQPPPFFSEDELKVIDDMDYVRPKDFLVTRLDELQKISNELKNDIQYTTAQINGYNRKKEKTKYDLIRLGVLKDQKDLMKKYKNTIDNYLNIR